LLSYLPPIAVSAGSAAPPPVRAEIVQQGIRLSLSMPRGPYAWNSFVPVTTRMTNLSNHVVTIGAIFGFTRCYVFAPIVEVQRRDGSDVFPPSVAGAMALPCPAPPPYGRTLQPGASIIVNSYAVLRAAHIRATVGVGQGNQVSTISTRPVTLSLRQASTPGVAIHTDGPIYATVTRPPGARGPMLAAWWWTCDAKSTAPNAGQAISRPSEVRAVGSTRLGPHLDARYCGRVHEWHAVAGWPGFPAARIDYVAPATG
jgi:hypothetical protein